MLVAEHYIEAIAEKLNLDIDHVRQVRMLHLLLFRYAMIHGDFFRQINLYKEAEKTPYHQKV
jgi:xanthine dehydrogenase/oxidase